VPDRSTEFLALPSVTLDAFQPLVPPLAAAFQGHMAAGRLDGTPRTARQFRVYTPGPWAPPEDRRFFRLTSLQTSSRPGAQGRFFGMGQHKANQNEEHTMAGAYLLLSSWVWVF